MKTGLESLETGAPNITYSGNEGPKPPQQMAMADPLLVEEYQKYVFEMEEQGLTPMSFEEFRLQAMSGMAKGGRVPAAFGGIMDSATGRKGYFGGSFRSFNPIRIAKKAVKAVAKPVKKILKSPIGKAALMAAAIYYGPQAAAKYFPRANPSSFMGRLASGKDLAFLDKLRATGSAFKTLLPGGTTPGGGISELKIPFLSRPSEIAGGSEAELLKEIIAETGPLTERQKLIAGATKALKGTKDAGTILGMKPSTALTTAAIVVPSTAAGMYTAAQPQKSLDDTVETASTGPSIKDVTGGLSLDDIARLARLNKLDSDYRFMGLPGTRLYSANGGRIGFSNGGDPDDADADDQDSSYDDGPLLIPDDADLSPDDFYGRKEKPSGIMMVDAKGPDYYANMYMKYAQDMINEGIEPMSIEDFVKILKELQTTGKAQGGRIGYDDGGLSSLRSAALTELYKTNDDEEDKKLAFGGSAGLPPITAGIEGQNSQSFSDDETPAPTQPDQMPRPRPMMNPMMASRMNPMMASRMNPMMASGMNPMMSMQPRMMAQDGGIMMASAPSLEDSRNEKYLMLFGKPLHEHTEEELEILNESSKRKPKSRIMAQEGGMMDMGGMEKDYRNTGGFVPIGGQERADDVPARLSKNEFVFTADAVRNAGGGDIDKGAEIMENMMENLEQGGKVSKESQGLSGARAMFATQQRLGEVL